MFCYRLSFRAPFHVDARGNGFYDESEAFIRSDTLSAAILSAWAQLEPQAAAERAASPPFLLSSAFPFYRSLYFLPRPVGSTAPRIPEDRIRDHKRLKKIQWLPLALWQQALAEDWQPDPDGIITVQDVLAMPGKLAADLPDGFRLWAHEERPRLAVDRATISPLEGLLFHFGRVHFQTEGGLYFLARFEADSDRKAFEAALSLLGDSGLGADRSSGNGFFRWQLAYDFPRLDAAATGSAIALSLVSPAPEDCGTDWLDGARYALVSRGGWIGGTGLRRKRLRLFAEGSQFRLPLRGRVIRVDPDGSDLPHPVFRDGRGFFVGTGAKA